MSDQNQQMLDAMGGINGNAARLIAEIEPGQWDRATPCSEWTVRDLVGHIVGVTRTFTASASRSNPPAPAEGDQLGDDPAATFAETADASMAAWRGDGALDGMVAIPGEMPAMAALGINVLDTGTHCWDLAKAIDAEDGLTDEQKALIDVCARRTVTDEVRAAAGFGPDLDDGSLQGFDATLAFLGRRP